MKWPPDLGRLDPGDTWRAECRRHHAHDRLQCSVQPDTPADDIRLAPEAPLPESVAQQNHVLLRAFGRKASSDGGFNAQQVEEICCHRAAREQFRLAFFRQHGCAAGHSGHAFEALILFAPVLEIWRRGRFAWSGGLEIGFPQNDQPRGICVRQRPQENAADHAKDRSVRADTKRQCEHGDQCKSRALGKHAESVTQIFEY